MSIKESGEMYLETILILSQNIKNVRSIDIVDYRGFSKPSVCRAVALLKKDGFILVDKNGFITLTDSGKSIAEKIYERHIVLTSVLVNLGVPEMTAAKDACKIEHDLSDETFECIKGHITDYGKNAKLIQKIHDKNYAV